MPVSFSADDSGAWGVMGAIAGFTKGVQTSAYINSVLSYTHAKLSQFFDEWMDDKARAAPTEFQHVYEWPNEWHEYRETVGVRRWALWKNTFNGGSKNATASFEFLPSERPTPVDPILLEPGPGGVVRENVHIFVFKAMAFEYAVQIEVEPKLAHFLAYVGRDQNSGGSDIGWHHANANFGDEEDESANMVNLSKGPVEFTAGGGKLEGNFTTAFLYWWTTMAGDDFERRIAPGLQQKMIDLAREQTVRFGKMHRKSVKITGQASVDHALFDEASDAAQHRIVELGGDWIIAAAAARRAEQL